MASLVFFGAPRLGFQPVVGDIQSRADGVARAPALRGLGSAASAGNVPGVSGGCRARSLFGSADAQAGPSQCSYALCASGGFPSVLSRWPYFGVVRWLSCLVVYATSN